MKEPPRDFAWDLATQLWFLNDSCERWDAKQQLESLRLALTLRIIFHQRNQTPLVERFPDYTSLTIWSTSSDVGYLNCPPDLRPTAQGLGLCILVDDQYVLPRRLMLSDRQVPWAEWWGGQVVWLIGDVKATRRDIITAVTNREGGAHVDDNRTAIHLALLRGPFGAAPYEEARKTPDKCLIFGAIRQIAEEVRNSTKLYDWAKVVYSVPVYDDSIVPLIPLPGEAPGPLKSERVKFGLFEAAR